MERILEPELLNVPPPADWRRINFLMRNARHIARALGTNSLTIADLGAGDGHLMLRVAGRLQRPGVEVTLVDRAFAVHESAIAGFEREQWKVVVAAEDVHQFLQRPGPRFDAIVANLFLHHFEREALRSLLELAAQRTFLFVACEPRRTRLALQASRLLWALGCNDVTRHDAVASVRAGFRDEELSQLWPREPGWRLAERPAWPFSHLFVAQRDATL
jgi:hypothetical protein